jgi:hypothetical protein
MCNFNDSVCFFSLMYHLQVVFILFLLMYSIHRIRVVIDVAEPIAKSF